MRPEKAKKSNFRRRTIGWNLHLEIYGSHVEEEDQKCTKSRGAPPLGGMQGGGGELRLSAAPPSFDDMLQDSIWGNTA